MWSTYIDALEVLTGLEHLLNEPEDGLSVELVPSAEQEHHRLVEAWVPHLHTDQIVVSTPPSGQIEEMVHCANKELLHIGNTFEVAEAHIVGTGGGRQTLDVLLESEITG